MGDHRAGVKIEFDFHGKVYKADMWINWSPDYDGIDERVREFFKSATEDGMARYEEKASEWRRQAEREQEERREREELARLKDKYEKAAEGEEG